jgi:hypothetical protein
MNTRFEQAGSHLIGVGLYTPAEAARLLRIPAGKISRWLRGHSIGGRRYQPLWTPQIKLEGDDLYLGFRDLMEMRTAHAFMERGVSAVMVRRAIIEARNFVDDERPLSTQAFMTDGQTIFIEIANEAGDPKLIDLFKRQYTFKNIIERSLQGVEFEGAVPARWWPASRSEKIVLDPERSFGQPIDVDSGAATASLAAAARAEGSEERAARLWQVPVGTVKRAVRFETALKAAA